MLDSYEGKNLQSATFTPEIEFTNKSTENFITSPKEFQAE